jgi:hypothetical protein
MALRGLWLALMGLLAVLMWNNLISGAGTALYGLLVLAVMVAEQVLSRRTWSRMPR